MSNDAMTTMNGIQAGIADVKNPEARINLSRDTVDTAIKDEKSTYAEAAYLRLGLCWPGAQGAITAWYFALLSSIVAEPQG